MSDLGMQSELISRSEPPNILASGKIGPTRHELAMTAVRAIPFVPKLIANHGQWLLGYAGYTRILSLKLYHTPAREAWEAEQENFKHQALMVR